MARKRMFNLSVVDTDAFLEMPCSTQALYFHLCMRADDDGFVGSPKVITRTVGASEDDLKVLIAKRFVLVFEDGVIVIKHWRMHNTLTYNRYTETTYLEHKAKLRIKENKAYTLGEGESLNDASLIESGKRQTSNRRVLDEQKTNKRQDIDEQKTSTDKISIGKNSIEKNSKESIGKSKFSPPTLDEVKAYCFERGNNVDPNRFIDYYSSNGWKVGRNNMKDWKAAVRTWERSEKKDKVSEGYDMIAKWAETED